MSVYKSSRNISKAQFLQEARNLLTETFRIVIKFPKRYRLYLTDDIVVASKNIYINCTKAQAIYVSKNISQKDFELRHRYLMMAYTNLQSLLCQIDLCYEVIDKGNNFFENKEYYDKQFEKWVGIGNTLEKLIKALISSDNKRFKEYTETKKQLEAKQKEKLLNKQFKENDMIKNTQTTNEGFVQF